MNQPRHRNNGTPEMVNGLLRKLLILLLSASAVFLALRTEYVPVFLWRPETEEDSQGQTATLSSQEAAEALCPRAVVLFQPDGARAASVYQDRTTLQWFRRFSALLGEAVGSAGPPEPLSEERFRGGLAAGGALFLLEYPCPLVVLSEWFGSGGGGAAAFAPDLLCLGLGEGRVELSFRADGNFYRCTTAVQPDTLSSRLEEPGEDVVFAWENPLLDGVEPYLPIVAQLPEIYTVDGKNGADYADTAALAEAVGMNSRLVTSYVDADGTLVLNEDGKSLRLGREGTLIFRAEEGANWFAPGELASAVGHVCGMMQRCAASCGGEGEIVFAGVETGSGGEVTVKVDYSIHGIPVLSAGGMAGYATVRDGAVQYAVLELRQLKATEQRETVLPMLQAAAIAAEKGGGTPRLAYESFGDAIRCVWSYR